MEINKAEVVAVQEVVEKVRTEVSELCELELALVGGGMGEVSLG